MIPTSLKSLLAGLLLAFVVLWGLNASFARRADVDRYLMAQERLVELAGTSTQRLDELIAAGEVTWDPTNGEEFARVLGNLKASTRHRVLLVGSSQMITLRDDRSGAAYQRRVDKVLRRLSTTPVEVYNLSMGGMTAEEKAIVIGRALDAMAFDQVIIALTLWDSLSTRVRSSLAGPPPDISAIGGGGGLETGFLSPAAINERAVEIVRPLVGQAVPAVPRRTAIRNWLLDTLLNPEAASAVAPETGESSAEPVRYRYTQPERQEAVMNNLDTLVRAAVQAKDSGAEVAFLLTPFRQDEQTPAYYPLSFYEEFVERLEERCREQGFELLDASRLLGQEHFGTYRSGSDQGRIDVLHFDAAAHARLAAFIANQLGLS